MNIQEIKNAVNAGHTVKWQSENYDVIKDKIGQYLIVCRTNNNCIGLTGFKGSPYENVLNGNENDFYISWNGQRIEA